MSDERFLARLAEMSAEYNLRAESAEMVRAELRKCAFQQDIEKFIRALGQTLPHIRALPEMLEKACMPDQDALAIADLVSKLKARLMLSDSLLVPMLLMDIEDKFGEGSSGKFIDGLYCRLDMLQAAAHAHIGSNDPKKGRPGQNNDAAMMFVSMVAHHWHCQMPDTKITPSGAFARICMGIGLLEGLNFKITRPAIEAVTKRKSKRMGPKEAGR